MRRQVRLVTLVIVVTASVWALALVLFGGVTWVVAGHRLRSNDPGRLADVAVGAAVLFALTGGIPLLVDAWHRARRRLAPVPVLGRLLSAQGTALVLAATLTGVGVAYMSTVASGADGSGYVSEADRFLHGPLRPPQPWVGQVPWPNAAWTFSPLGYRPVEETPPFRQAPTYSPGLPLLMAAAKLVGGQAALFLVVPMSAGILVFATFGLARRLAGPSCGVVAAWLVATSPIVIFMLALPMSDVPVAAAWTAGMYFLLGVGPWAALAAGLSSSVAILIRPNLAFLAAVMSLWYLVRVDGPGWAVARRLRDGVCYSVGVVPGVVFVALFFNYLYGSPFTSGYGRFADSFDSHHATTNLRLYFEWALGAQTTFTIAGLLGLLVPWIWPAGAARRAVAIFALVLAAVTAEYAVYLVFDDWAFLRFFLPVWSLLAIGAAGVATCVMSWLPARFRWVIVAVVATLGVTGVETAGNRYAFELWHGNRRYTAAAELIHEVAVPNSVVFTMEHSGSVRYYAGLTPIRYDILDPDWLDRSVAWLAERGVHSYAVLDEFELPRIRERFKGQREVYALDNPILVYQAYRQGAFVYLYDLTTPPSLAAQPRLVVETNPGRWRNWPGGPTPTLVFHAPGG